MPLASYCTEFVYAFIWLGLQTAWAVVSLAMPNNHDSRILFAYMVYTFAAFMQNLQIKMDRFLYLHALLFLVAFLCATGALVFLPFYPVGILLLLNLLLTLVEEFHKPVTRL